MKIQCEIFVLALMILVCKQGFCAAAREPHDRGDNMRFPIFIDPEWPREPQVWNWNNDHTLVEIVACPEFFDASALPQADSTTYYRSQIVHFDNSVSITYMYVQRDNAGNITSYGSCKEKEQPDFLWRPRPIDNNNIKLNLMPDIYDIYLRSIKD